MTRHDPDKLPDDASSYEFLDISDDAHMRFRKCAACGHQRMKPIAAFAGDTMGTSSETGLAYACPDCEAEVMIPDSGGVFMGLIYSLFWGAVALFVFWQGPLWYIRHWSYMSADDGIGYLLIDFLIILLGLAVIGFCIWVIWLFLLRPLKTLILHPVTGENRTQSVEETAAAGTSRRNWLISLLVLPLLAWVPLLGILWGLDAVGLDLHDNKLPGYAALGAVLVLVAMAGKRFGSKPALTMIGMVLWLGVIVAAIFTFA